MNTLIVLAIVGVVLIGIVAVVKFRRRPERVPAATCTVDSAWDHYCSDRAK